MIDKGYHSHSPSEENKEDEAYVVKYLPNPMEGKYTGNMSMNHLSSIPEAPSVDEYSQYSRLMRIHSKPRASKGISKNFVK